MRTNKLIILSLCFLTQYGIASQNELTVNDALKSTKIIVYPENGRPVDRTVAEELKEGILHHAIILSINNAEAISQKGVLRISILDEKFFSLPKNLNQQEDWMFFKLDANGNGELLASKPHLLYPLFCQLKEEWLDSDLAEFENGKILKPKFTWLRGDDGFFTGKKRFSRGYDPEGSIKELARMGCSHVVINALATPFSSEQGPPGEIYYRFYIGAPDLDLFVETDLNKGTYPPE
ncbi:MAG TPA: hypothetical protein VGD14_19630, partial [bacterium]